MSNELTAITPAQVNILTQRTPHEAVKTRQGRGGKILSYVSHDWVTRQLNEAFNWQWSFEILSERILPDETAPREIVVKGRLTIHTPHGDLIKNQFGSSEVKRTKSGDIISLGDDLKAASSDALKKCASLLGLALDLYGDSQPASPPQPQTNGTSNGNGGKLAPDPMTNYWAEVRARGIPHGEAIDRLKQAGGNAAKALQQLI